MTKAVVRKKLDIDQAMVEILARVSDGESVREICNGSSGHLPSTTTFYRWMASDTGDEWRDRYAQAMEVRGRNYGELVCTLAARVIDDPDLCPQRARVAIDALKWAAGRLSPSQYGDRVEIAGSVTATLVPIMPSK